MATTEERLAALEAKLAQLTATTPTTYYTHQYSGEEIDAAVGRAVTGGALDASVTNVSNQLGTFVRPNLLDNWYFGNPINQRGQAEYTADGYCIDRWVLAGDTATLNGDGITFVSPSPGRVVRQPIEFSDSLSGKTVTFSIYAKVISGNWFLTDTDKFSSEHRDVHVSDGVTSWTFEVNDASKFGSGVGSVGFWGGVEGGQITILAAKLELGPTQTLAHREGDKWVLNEVPDYGEQLRRCQRYAIDLHGPTNYGVLGSGVARRTNRASIFCPLPVSMRVTPVATFGGSLTLASDADAGRGYVVTAVNVDHINSNGITLNVDTAGLTISTVYQLWRQGDASTHILLSADL